MGCSPAGHFFLRSKRGDLYRILWDRSGPGIVLRKAGGDGDGDGGSWMVVGFDPVQPPGGARFGLGKAELPGGARAYLDARGFLHLVPATRDLPEVTLALRSTALRLDERGQFLVSRSMSIPPNPKMRLPSGPPLKR
ncbi:MAG: hypothetical protein R3F11_10115 [Verrucomicrobiales bacterium]